MNINPIGPYLYPNGFPLLLSPLYHLLGINFMAMKLYCSVFFLCSIPLAYDFFKKYIDRRLAITVLVVVLFFNRSLLLLADNVLSDFPFLFFSLLTIYFIEKNSSFITLLITGILLFFPYYIRDVGIFMLPVFVLYQIVHYKRQKINIALKLLPYFIFASLFFLNYVIYPFGSENHLEILLQNFSKNLVFKNTSYYLNLIAEFFFFVSKPIFGLFVVIVALIGMVKNTRNLLPYILYLLLNILILLIWSSRQGVRLIIPSLPILLVFIGLGINNIINFFISINLFKKNTLSFLNYMLFIYFYIYCFHSGV